MFMGSLLSLSVFPGRGAEEERDLYCVLEFHQGKLINTLARVIPTGFSNDDVSNDHDFVIGVFVDRDFLNADSSLANGIIYFYFILLGNRFSLHFGGTPI